MTGRYQLAAFHQFSTEPTDENTGSLTSKSTQGFPEEYREETKRIEQQRDREAHTVRAQHSERNAVENRDTGTPILRVKRTQLVEAFKRTTKMKRAPAGARSSRLKEGAFVPELGGFRVEMPGGSSLVDIEEGRLEREVLFVAAKIEPALKVLSTYNAADDVVHISIEETAIVFRCSSSKLTIPRKM